MTRLQALKELARKVEAGEYTTSGDADDMWLKWHDAFSPRDWKSYNELAQRAYNGSLDAAQALHEALLPGWGFSMSAPIADLVSVDVWINAMKPETASSDNPARSWLLSILKAMIAQEVPEPVDA